MNAIETLLDQPIFQALGWTLIHFIWQGALIALLYLSVSVLLRRFAANVRYAAACGAMLLMVIAPAVTMLSIDYSSDQAPATELALVPSESDQVVGAITQSPIEQLTPARQTEIEAPLAPQATSMRQWAQERLPRTIPWLLALWFAGVLCLSLRFAGGLMTVQRLKRTETSSNIQLWQEKLATLSHRLRVSRPVRLCESALVEVPTVIGWLRPVILLPASALTGLSTEQLEALLAHELAHIRRYDYLVNLLQTSIETLFFYHPAVWWVSAQARQEREHCCDDLAVDACGDVLTYARALTALEHLRGSEVQLAVAATGGSLLVRIQRLLRRGAPAHYGFESGLAGFIALGTLFILLAGAQTALLSRNAKAAQGIDQRKEANEAVVLKMTDGAPRSADQGAKEAAPVADDRRALDQAATPSSASPLDEEAVIQNPSGSAATEAPSQSDKPGDSHDLSSEIAAALQTSLNDDLKMTLKVNGITPQFIREMSRLVSAKLTVDLIVAMRIHGVTEAFAEEMKAQGLANLTADQLIAFRIHGVTSQFVSELRNVGCGAVTPDSLVAFRIHGVTPAFVQQLRDVGLDNLSGDQLSTLAIHGVTPLFVQTMKSFIPGKLTVNDLLGLRIHGVTPEMIKALEIMGYANLSASQLMALRIHSVTPAFIRSIQENGYDRITVEQLSELRMAGVTPEFIQLVKGRGFTDVTPHQLAELKRLNILPSAKQN